MTMKMLYKHGNESNSTKLTNCFHKDVYFDFLLLLPSTKAKLVNWDKYGGIPAKAEKASEEHLNMFLLQT